MPWFLFCFHSISLVCVSYSVEQVPYWGVLGTVPLSEITDNTAVNNAVQRYTVYTHECLGWIYKCRTAGSKINQMWVLPAYLFFTFPPLTMVQFCISPQPGQEFTAKVLQCSNVFRCGIWLWCPCATPLQKGREVYFHVLNAISISSFEGCLFRSPAHFCNEFWVFLEKSWLPER